MWQRWLVIGLVLLVIGVVAFEEATTPDEVKLPPKQEEAQELPTNTGSESDMQEEPADNSSLDQPAEFPGGGMNLKRWLAENIRYPQEAIELGIEGTVYVRFAIDKNGEVRNPVIMRGAPDCPECDQEVIRVMKMMPRWNPARKNGKPVNTIYNLPVKFRLE